MSSNNKGLFVIGMLLIVLMAFSCVGNFNLSKIATDSGFDTSYDSGGSDWGGSSDWGSDSSGGDGDMFGLGENIILGVFFIIIPVSILFNKKKEKTTKDKVLLILASIIIVVLTLCRLLVLLFTLSGLLFMAWAMITLAIDSIFKKKKKNKGLPLTAENRKILDECYEIFINVQNAWMNFDYDSLRKETTDNLYNTYYNQLQSLVLKGQKNVMSDFELVEYKLIKLSKKNSITTVKIELEVKFYDYIVDSSNKVVRGKKRKKVHMLYDLTYVYNEEAIEECPNCNAKISKEDNICSYCKTTIPSIRGKMKLSTKKCIRQR